jgi:hypothetical protein
MTISDEERTRLRALYEKACYEAYPQGANHPIQIKLGVDHPSIDDELGALESWMFITAYEPMGQKHPPRRNRLAQQRLLREVKRKQKQRWRARGYAPDNGENWEEPSLLVFPVSKSEALDWARRYRQLAILFGSQGEKAQLLFAD